METESEPAVASAEETDESREFLRSIGIEGEIISTPSHSEDSISVILDCGDCFVGDLEPYEYLDGYEDNLQLQKDWDQIRNMNPKRILHAHANEKILGNHGGPAPIYALWR